MFLNKIQQISLLTMKITPAKDTPKRTNYLLPPRRLEWPEAYIPVKVKLGVDSGINDLFYTIDGT